MKNENLLLLAVATLGIGYIAYLVYTATKKQGSGTTTTGGGSGNSTAQTDDSGKNQSNAGGGGSVDAGAGELVSYPEKEIVTIIKSEPAYIVVNSPYIQLSSAGASLANTDTDLIVDCYDQYGRIITEIDDKAIVAIIRLQHNDYVKLWVQSDKDDEAQTVVSKPVPIKVIKNIGHFDVGALIPVIGWGRGFSPDTMSFSFTVHLKNDPNIFSRGNITVTGVSM